MSAITLRSRIGVELIQRVGSDAGIVAAARVATHGIGPADSDGFSGHAGLIRYLMAHRHGSPFEHGLMTFAVEAPIFVFREWHRHRIGWSYNEASGRYRQLEPVFWVPDLLRPVLEPAGFKPARPTLAEGTARDHEELQRRFAEVYRAAWGAYSDLLAGGVAREVARAVLPVGTYSSMYATCNPRSLMHFLALRTHDPAAATVSYPQAEIESAARQMEAEFARLFPLTHGAFCAAGRVAP